MLANQYSASPAGEVMNMNVKSTGMNIIIFCWTGSSPVIGIIRCSTIMRTAAIVGNTP
ncbi:hypothetical protein D3C83_250960 [compost metagenome]